jgi:SAM-dependent methyltransferase
MLKKLESVYRKEQFDPSLLALFVLPYYFTRKGLRDGVKRHARALRGRLLDFGCGRKPYRHFFDVTEYVGLDFEKAGHDHAGEEIDIFYDGKRIPCEDQSFDSVLCSEVFEHLFNLEEILDEMHRVMKPGAHLLATLPFVCYEHEEPYDYARYSTFGIRHLLEKHGFEVVALEKSSNFLEAVFQMWNAYLYLRVFPKNRALKVLLTPFFIAPFTILGLLVSKLSVKSDLLYLNDIVLARKKTA